MGKKRDARIAQNEANMQEMQAKLEDNYVNARVQAGGEDQMSPECKKYLLQAELQQQHLWGAVLI